MPRIILVFALLMAVLVAGCGGSDKPMRSSDPNLSQAHVERAKFFWAHNEINKAIQEMEWAIKANPYNYDAAYNLGLIYLDQGQRISARRVWENALTYMQDGDGAQLENYDNARKAAEIQAALAELDKADRQLGSPEAIVAGQQASQNAQASTAGQTGGSTAGTTITTTTSDTTYYSSQPGMPQQPGGTQVIGETHTTQVTQTTHGTSQAGSGQSSQRQPKPYVPSPQDGKPAPRTQSSSRATDCPPCAPQTSGKYAIQVSSNKQQKSAQQDVSRLSAKGYHATIATNQLSSGTWYVVWAGCCTTKEQAQKLAADLIKQGLIPRDARVAIPK